MEYRKITAILNAESLDHTAKALQGIGVHGISITHVMGHGEYANFYAKDLCCKHAHIEIFTHQSKAKEIAATIMNAAHTGMAGDGIVAILPVENIYRIRTKSEANRETL
ncbi:MAG: P-II family nitrogen regulator [Mariprofundaceae bacterium]|nr:P-II family nitrogen regulator [Mariprofundaceae bacterium]